MIKSEADNNQKIIRQLYRKRPSTDFNQMMGIGKEADCRYVWAYRIAIGYVNSVKSRVSFLNSILMHLVGAKALFNCLYSMGVSRIASAK